MALILTTKNFEWHPNEGTTHRPQFVMDVAWQELLGIRDHVLSGQDFILVSEATGKELWFQRYAHVTEQNKGFTVWEENHGVWYEPRSTRGTAGFVVRFKLV